MACRYSARGDVFFVDGSMPFHLLLVKVGYDGGARCPVGTLAEPADVAGAMEGDVCWYAAGVGYVGLGYSIGR